MPFPMELWFCPVILIVLQMQCRCSCYCSWLFTFIHLSFVVTYQHFQRDIVRGVEGFIVTGSKQVEIGKLLAFCSQYIYIYIYCLNSHQVSSSQVPSCQMIAGNMDLKTHAPVATLYLKWHYVIVELELK